MVTRLALAAAFALLALPCAHAALDGARLLETCRDEDEDVRFLCSTYIVGALDMYRLVSNRNAFDWTRFPPVCTPEDMTNDQLRLAVAEYIEANPRVKSWPASMSVFVVLRKTWPCPE